MFKGFNLNLDNTDGLHSSDEYSNILKSREQNIQSSLDKYLMSDGSIDASELSLAWFPEITSPHVFISHSHQDVELAKKLADWLYDKFKIMSFIDSEVWGYSENLLKQIDNEYAYQPESGTYRYSIRNLTTSHVHMMLSSALNSMINQSECLIFLNTNNAISDITSLGYDNKDRTSSPWIMSELHTSAIIQKKMDIGRENLTKAAGLESRSLEESAMDSSLPKFEYAVDLNHLHKLDINALSSWSKNTSDEGYYALTELYNSYGGESLTNIKQYEPTFLEN
ncbi:MAG: hypothetical protein JKY50_01375 [Oleispira sp.]|nr:hypothetical protein [Oleispira sp.]MBL4881613.1 hypothetical protein [Oleispira sp.]